MGFSLGTLTAYSKEDTRAPLFAALYTELGAMQREANILTGVKSSVKLPYIDDTIVFQTGGGCSAINPSGSTTITQKEISVGKVAIYKDFCPDDLEAYFTQQWLKNGALYDENALPTFLTEFWLKKVKDRIATRDWFATSAADKYTGLGTSIETDGGYVSATATADVTASNVIGIIDNMYQLVPGRIQTAQNLRLFMGQENYRYAITAYKNANYFNHGDFAQAAAAMEFTAPGTNIKVTADPGLNASVNGTDRMYLLSTENVWMAVDGTGDDEAVDMWYEKKDQKIYARCGFKRGFKCATVSEVVRYANF